MAHPDESLNGAQVTALLEVIRSVGTGEIPKDAAKELIAAAFPIAPDRVNKMIDPVEVKPPPDAAKPIAPMREDTNAE